MLRSNPLSNSFALFSILLSNNVEKVAEINSSVKSILLKSFPFSMSPMILVIIVRATSIANRPALLFAIFPIVFVVPAPSTSKEIAAVEIPSKAAAPQRTWLKAVL